MAHGAASASLIMARSRSTSLAIVTRIEAIDLLRGLVIMLMILDHVRDYFHASAWQFDPLDPTRTTALLYATRWVTHLCAPSFVFLAGVSAWLKFDREKDAARLSRFLLMRGLWLVLLELTVINFGWAFTFGLIFMQVIWAIGWSMVMLAALVWLPRTAVLAIGVAIVAGHNLLDPIQPQQLGGLGTAWIMIMEGGVFARDGAPFMFNPYPILPWAGVMMLGYGLGDIFTRTPDRRDRMLILLGAAMIALFVLLRLINLYGDPRPWTAQDGIGRTLMAFLDVTKYPPSLMFVCATLGVALLLIPLLARLRGPAAQVLLAFGSVPLFAYVLHIYVMHGLAVLAALITGRNPAYLIDFIGNLFLQPQMLQGTGYPLAVVYAVWLFVLALLYPLCRYWSGLKHRRRDWWLSYL